MSKLKEEVVEEKKYEELMDELSKIVEKMEDPETKLEDQLNSYERGMTLCNKLFSILKSYEDRITIINNEGKEESFE